MTLSSIFSASRNRVRVFATTLGMAQISMNLLDHVPFIERIAIEVPSLPECARTIFSVMQTAYLTETSLNSPLDYGFPNKDYLEDEDSFTSDPIRLYGVQYAGL